MCASAWAHPASASCTGRRQVAGQLGPAVLGRDDHHVERAAGGADEAVELLRDIAQVLGRELVDVPLEARLRPAALVVAAGLLLGEVGDGRKLPVREAKEAPAFAAGDDDERPVATPDERASGVSARRRSRLTSSPTEARIGRVRQMPSSDRAKDGDSARAVADELLVEPAANAVEVASERDPLRVGERPLLLAP